MVADDRTFPSNPARRGARDIRSYAQYRRALQNTDRRLMHTDRSRELRETTVRERERERAERDVLDFVLATGDVANEPVVDGVVSTPVPVP